MGDGKPFCTPHRHIPPAIARRIPTTLHYSNRRPCRHSGVGRNPESRCISQCESGRGWIPAFAGMTGWQRKLRDAGRKPLPSPSGRGLGEGETPGIANPGENCQRRSSPPSFPRKRESTPRPIAAPGLTGVLDSGRRRNDGLGGGGCWAYFNYSRIRGVDSRFRGNDGGGGGFCWGWRCMAFLPRPTLSRWERARGLRRQSACSVIPGPP